MVGKNNTMVRELNNEKYVPHYGIRKLSVGVASVLLGTTMYFGVNSAVAHADTVDTTGSDQVSDNGTEQNVVGNVNNDAGQEMTTLNTTNVQQNSGQQNVQAVQNNLSVQNTTQSTNGGFDQATWGKLDVHQWSGAVQGDYYVLNNYTGDRDHIIVPNAADFANAGIDISGKQVGVTSDFIGRLKGTSDANTFAFSKTNGEKIIAIGDYWTYTWNSDHLVRFNGASFDISNVTRILDMFANNQIKDLSSLTNWNTSNVTSMRGMFAHNQIHDLSPLMNWDISNVVDMNTMFASNQIHDLSPLVNWDTSNVITMEGIFENNQIEDLNSLTNWNVSNVTNMGGMFMNNQIHDLNSLTNWNTGKVTSMRSMFNHNQIKDLNPLANWDTSNVTDMNALFSNNQIKDLNSLTNWNTSSVTYMGDMFSFNQIKDLSPLVNWDIGKVTSTSNMFH